MKLNEKIRILRTQVGMSQQQLADRLGVSRQTINAIENGDYNPTIRLCIGICKELGLTLNDLFWE
jgi:putative transcriptional regulator